jgi:D-alanine transaminase
MERLDRSLMAIEMKPVFNAEKWHKIFTELLDKNSITNQNCMIYLQVTRGADAVRNHAFPENMLPTIVAFISPLKNVPAEKLEQGFSAITHEDLRRRDCHIKGTALLPNILAYNKAHREGAAEAILIRDNYAMEGTSSNVFIAKNGVIITPPITPTILAGVTRALVIRLATENSLKLEEKSITKEELFDADEIWMTGSGKEICPISQLDNKPVGNGALGPVCRKILNYYQNYKASLLKSPV